VLATQPAAFRREFDFSCVQMHQMSKSMSGSFGQLMRNLDVPDEFRPTAMHQPVSHKRLARARWAKLAEYRPHEKKEKFQ
jgi:hypothetical protein